MNIHTQDSITKVRFSASNWIAFVGILTTNLVITVGVMLHIEHRLTVLEVNQINNIQMVHEMYLRVNALEMARPANGYK